MQGVCDRWLVRAAGKQTYEIDLAARVQKNVGTSQQRAVRIVSLCGEAAAAESDDDAESDGPGIEEWEYEDGLPGSGDWKPVEKTMASGKGEKIIATSESQKPLRSITALIQISAPPRRGCSRPGADVAGVSTVPAQMWQQ